MFISNHMRLATLLNFRSDTFQVFVNELRVNFSRYGTTKQGFTSLKSYGDVGSAKFLRKS